MQVVAEVVLIAIAALFQVLAGSIDEATRERLIAEHLASNLQNNSLSTALLNAGLIPTNAFVNLTPPGAINHAAINLLRAPVATLAQSFGLQHTAAVVNHHMGIKAVTGGLHPNRLQLQAPGIPDFNHALALHVPGLPNPHQYITGIPGVGFGGGSKAPGVLAPLGSQAPGAGGPSSSSNNNNSTHSKSPGPSVNHNLASRVLMTSGSQNMIPRVAGVNMAHSGLLRTGSWQGGPPPAGIQQVGPSQTATLAQLNASLGFQRTPIQAGGSGYIQQKQKQLGHTYLDEFKQGFPSKGLSVSRNRWWGTAESARSMEAAKATELTVPDVSTDGKSAEADKGPASQDRLRVKVMSKEVALSFAKVTKLRRGAVERGRNALQLAASRGYGVQKLEHRHSRTLEFVFGRSLPKQWSSAVSICE
ncbi:hypothetical protein R1sor_010828 [Riccia sorocarpa]|uniref:Uncharacterized protein n=1 Tax=Riccia sorocarpa TaxID=122646 RepID=A0ABD3HZ64_9MARC